MDGSGGIATPNPMNEPIRKEGEYRQLTAGADQADALGGGIESGLNAGLSLIPGIGGILGGASSLLGKLTEGTKDEYGIYKSAGSEVLDRVFNPVGTIGDLFSGELFGGQKRRKDARDLAQYRDVSRNIAANVGGIGAKTKFSI